MRRVAAALALVCGLCLGAGPSPGGAEAEGPLLGRSFTANAEAFPIEPAPGSNQTTLGIRPVSTRAGARNPAAAAFARAAASDMGLIEAYVGQQGPSAEADTSAANGQPDAHVEEGGMVLDAHATRLPKSWSTAVGNDVPGSGFSFGSSSSASTVDGSGRALTAVSWAEVQNAVSGPLAIGSARFDAAASADGVPGGAKAEGRVTASDATVAGVPVIIDDHGLRVDQQAVPADQLATLTEAVHTALNRGGYIDVRVVQPTVEVSPDGLRASVSGGGVRIHMSTNDPTNNYFLELNLVGGMAGTVLGPAIGGRSSTDTAAVPLSAPARGPDLIGGDFGAVVGGGDFAGSAGAPVVSGSGPATPRAATPLDDVIADAASYRLQGRWPGWPWLLASLLLVAGLCASLTTEPMAPARRRLSVFADRYLRG